MTGLTRLTFDEALTHHVGEFGWGQKLIVLLTSFLGLPNGIAFLIWVFMTIDPIKNFQWRCVDSGDAACAAAYAAPKETITNSFCSLPADSWEWTNLDSVVSQFNLVCSEAWKVQFANTLMFIGCVFGSAIFGYLSDKIGRKGPMYAATALSAAAIIIMLAAQNYWLLAAARFVTGMGASGMVLGIYLICAEITGQSYRGLVGTGEFLFFAFGELLLVGLASHLTNWRHITIAAGIMAAAPVLLYFFTPESARWLLSQGQHDRAVQLLRKVARQNGTQLPEHVLLCSTSSEKAMAERADNEALHCEDGFHGVSDKDSSSGGRHYCHSGRTEQQQQQQQQGTHQLSSSSTAAGAAKTAACSSDRSSKGTTFCDADRLQHTGSGIQHDSAFNVDQDLEAAAAAAAAGPEVQKPAGFRVLLGNRMLAIMSAVFALTWFTNFFAYYGITFGIGDIPGSIYTVFSLNSAAELVSYVLTASIIDKVGRHNVSSGGLLLGGAMLLATANVTGWVKQTVLLAVAKFGICSSISAAPTYTVEVFPTVVRSRALGIFIQASRVGCIFAPLMLLLGTQQGHSRLFVPYTMMGVLSLLCGAMLLMMPETLGLPMIESLEDLCQLQSVFSARPWRNGGGARATLAFIFRRRASPTH